MELIDITDSAALQTGVRKSKSDVHRDGDWHVAAHVWLVTGEREILLQRRALAKENYPGLWDVSAAGHVSAGETAETAALRETFEELGVVLDPSQLRSLGRVSESVTLNDGAYIDNEIHEVYLVRFEGALPPLQLDPLEVDAATLVSAAELALRITRNDPTLVPHDASYALLLAALE